MWQPQGNTVFVRKFAAKSTTEGGIVLPTAQLELTLEGEIVCASTLLAADWIGTKVLFSKFAGSEVKVSGEALLIMRVEDILAMWQDGE